MNDTNSTPVKPTSDGSKVSQYLDYISGVLEVISDKLAELTNAGGEEF